MRTNTLTRMLDEPSSRERDLLEQNFSETFDHIIKPENVSQASFIDKLTGDLDARVIHVSKNTDQRMIIVTHDKTLLCLKRNLAKLGKKEWIAPMSTVTTLLISLITSDFKYALGLGRAEWRAIFIVSALIATGWLAHAVRKALNAKTYHEVIQGIVEELCDFRRPVPDQVTS